MKFKNLLILFAMLLIGGTASAAIVDGVRQKPVPEKAAFNYGDTLYMYNVGAKMFWGGGNDWNTRASVVEEGVQVVFIKELVNGEWDGKTSTLRNWCVQHKRWDNVFVSGADGTMWVDNSSDPNHFWNLVAQSDEVYRLQVSDMNTGFPGDGTTFVGHNATLDNGANTRTWAFLTPGEGMNIDWYFVNQASFDAYMALLPAYNASKDLLAIIEEAKAKGLNVSEQQAVYENESSTIEEINGAIDTLQKLIAALDEFSASAENPSDKTSLITNPSYDANTNDGWSGTTPGFQSYTNAEVYQGAYNAYQDLSGMPNGVYMLQVQAFYRAGWADVSFTNFLNGTQKNASIYAKVGEDSIRVAVMNAADGALTDKYGVGNESEVTVDGVKYYLPNDMNSAATYFSAGRYINTLFFSVEDSKARIGIADKTTADDLAGNWTIWDNWTLTYYGNKEDAFKLWIDNVIADAPNFDNLPEGKYVTNGMVDTYKATIEAVSGAATKADILAAQVAIAEAAAVVEKNIAAWDSLVIARNKAEATSADPGIADTDEKMALADYVWELDDMIAALEMTTEELLAEARKVQEMIDYVYANAMLPGTDVTEKFLVNPDYSKGTTGWKGNWTAVAQGCMEAYAIDWDAYQEVTSAPVGVYEVSLQGFYRVKRGSEAWTMYQNGQQICPGHVYVNNNQTEVPCIFSEPVNKLENIYSGNGSADGDYMIFESETLDSLCFPNTMTTASEAFAKGMYKASAFGLVAKKGDVLRLGVKGKKQDATWVIWDNFRMVYQGFKVEIIKPELEKAIANAKANQDKPMGKEVKKILLDGIIKGTAALALSDGKVMFDALSALYSANDSIAPSVALFEELAKVAADMFTQASTSSAAQDVITAAGTLYAEIMGAIDEGTLENADAEAYIIKVKEMNTKLRIPAGEASEESPLDMTSVIYTPGFEKDGANSIEGWENTDGYSFGNDDTQKAALMVEFYQKKFDIYQDLVGLPNGLYEVAVQAFCSFGNSTTDYDNFTKNPNVNEAWLYAIPANDSTQMATAYLKHRSSEAGPDKGYTGTTTITGANGESLVMPNDVVSSGNYMSNEGLYWNKVIVKVTDGTLRIGVAKPEQIAGDWVVMDNWQLKYYGEVKSENDFVVNDVSARAGQTISFPVALNNNTETAAFQCDVYLPEGVTLLTNKGKYDITLDDVRKDDHSVSSALQDNGSVRIIVASLTNAPFEGNSGNIFYLKLSVAEGLSGSFPIEIKDIHITDSKGNRTDLANVSANLNVEAYIPGDVNNDGMVVVDDVVNAINYVLGTTPEGFVFTAADMNSDKQILVDDVVQIINTILGISSAKEQEVASLELEADDVSAGDKFYLNDFVIKPGESKEIAIQFETENVSASDPSQQMYVAFQFDIHLPKGLTVAQKKGKYNFVLNEERKDDDHTISSAMQEDGAIRVLGASLTNSYFWEKKGDFVVFTVTAAEDFVGTHDISLKNIMFTEKSGKRTDLADVTTKVSDGDVNGIEGVDADGNKIFKVYTIDGKQTLKSGARKGVYIINGKKAIIK